MAAPNALNPIGAIIQNSYPEKAKKGFFPPPWLKKNKNKRKHIKKTKQKKTVVIHTV